MPPPGVKAMLTDRDFLRLAATGASLAVGLSFGLAVAVVSAAEPTRPPAITAAAPTRAEGRPAHLPHSDEADDRRGGTRYTRFLRG